LDPNTGKKEQKQAIKALLIYELKNKKVQNGAIYETYPYSNVDKKKSVFLLLFKSRGSVKLIFQLLNYTFSFLVSINCQMACKKTDQISRAL